MQTLQCEIKGLKNYEIEIWKSGACSSLAEIRVIDSSAYFEYTGLCNIKDFISIDRRSSVTEGLFKLLMALRKITEGMSLAEDYLIDQNSVSLKLEDLWFDKEGRVKLLPGKIDEKRFIDRMVDLLIELNKEDLAEKIKEKDRTSAMSYKDLLSFLSSFELELR